MRMHTISYLIICSIILQAGQTAAQVELVAPGVISTIDRQENFPAEDPVDGSLWFSVIQGEDFSRQTIYRSEWTEDGWQTPEIVSFSGTWGDRAPRFSPDGKRLYFTSTRPTGSEGNTGNQNIWMVEREGNGSWGEPVSVPSPVSESYSVDMHMSITADNTVYLASSRTGNAMTFDIFRIAKGEDGQPEEALLMPPPVNGMQSRFDLLVSPDTRWMIVAVVDRSDGYGRDDLYLSRFENGVWTELRNLGQSINTRESEYGPGLSRNGQYLYFTSFKRGDADIYRVKVSSIDLDG